MDYGSDKRDHPFAFVQFTGSRQQRELGARMYSLALYGARFELVEDVEIVIAALEPVVQKEDWNLRAFEFHCMVELSMGGSADYAIRRMTERLREDPDDDLAALMMCTALRNVGDPEWEPQLDRLLATCTDPYVRAVGFNMKDHKEFARRREQSRPGRERRAAERAAILCA